jgi:hypothetical protein
MFRDGGASSSALDTASEIHAMLPDQMELAFMNV